MEGVKGGAELGMAGAAQQGTMLGQGIGAVQAAGGAREQQMQGVKDQGGFIDQQGNYVQAQLASTESDITQASTEEQARLTRSAQGTPDDPRYRPPAETPPAVGAATGDLPPGTTVAPPPPGGGLSMPPPASAPSATPAPVPEAKPQGGVNAAPPQLQGAPVNQAKPQGRMMAEQDQIKATAPGGGMADAQAQAGQGAAGMMGQQGMMNQQAKGMMGAQQGQGNNQQAMAQNQAELTKQMGQAGAVRGSWKDAQAGGGASGGGVASMMGGGGSPFGQGQAGIAQQGGLMGQNAPMNADQQQQADEMFKKKRQATMQGFAVGGA